MLWLHVDRVGDGLLPGPDSCEGGFLLLAAVFALGAGQEHEKVLRDGAPPAGGEPMTSTGRFPEAPRGTAHLGSVTAGGVFRPSLWRDA